MIFNNTFSSFPSGISAERTFLSFEHNSDNRLFFQYLQVSYGWLFGDSSVNKAANTKTSIAMAPKVVAA